MREKIQNTLAVNPKMIGASVSEPHTSLFNYDFS